MSEPKTVGDVLRAATDYLAKRDVYQSRQACEILASRLLKCKRLELYVKFDSPMSEKQLAAMRRGVNRLAAGEPVQYITGQVEFMGHVFKVDRRALIPRPETEVLVETALNCEAVWHAATPRVADLGTGCGCIAVSLALARPQASYVAVDVSQEALELAAENAAALGALDRIVFSGHDLSEDVDPDSLDAVVANLPYVPAADWEKLPAHISKYEPRASLDGGADGLAIIRDAIPDAWIVLKAGGFLFLEIGEDQGERVAGLLKDAGFREIDIRKDLASRDRVVVGIKQEI